MGRDTLKSSILIGFSIINHPFWGTPYFWETPTWLYPGSCSFLRKCLGSDFGDDQVRVHRTRFKECIITVVVFLPGISWEWFFHKNVYGNSMFFSEISAVTGWSPFILLFFWVNI